MRQSCRGKAASLRLQFQSQSVHWRRQLEDGMHNAQVPLEETGGGGETGLHRYAARCRRALAAARTTRAIEWLALHQICINSHVLYIDHTQETVHRIRHQGGAGGGRG